MPSNAAHRTGRREWEDHIRLFLPVEVIRRNVLYQLKGSDDKNASFFDFTPRPGESYDSAFFRSVVAPDLLSNLLSSFSEEDESAVEDTLLKSLTRIVDAEREIVRKERRLQIRETGIEQLRPIMEAGTSAQDLKGQRDTILRSLRKNIAFLRHFGVQGGHTTLPGMPRSLPNLGDQDPRIMVALKGMVITRDDGILLLDKTLSELAGIEVSKINEVASRKSLLSVTPKTQVIDFACDLVISGAGNQGGGHFRKGYPRDSALSDQRAAIAADLRARIASDRTQAHETQAPDCTTSPETPTDDTQAFQRTRPANVDLRALIAQGMTPADLVGLGVVYSGDMANASGHGAIVEAHDGGARGVLVAVTLEDGRHMAQLDGYSFADRPGNRYALDWKRHGTPYLAELAAKRAGLKAATSSAKEIKAQRHAAELERLAAEFPHLERADSRHAGGKLAARNIRTLLKSAFPGQKFSVTSDYSSVNVRWADGPVGAAVDAIIARFDIGRADYNTDYFYTEESAWSELFGGVQYLFTSRDESPELVARVLEAFNAKHGTSATPDDWRKWSGPFNAYTQRDADAYRRWFREMLNTTDATPTPKDRRSAKP